MSQEASEVTYDSIEIEEGISDQMTSKKRRKEVTKETGRSTETERKRV